MVTVLKVMISVLIGLVVILFFELWGASVHVALIPGTITTGATLAFIARK